MSRDMDAEHPGWYYDSKCGNYVPSVRISMDLLLRRTLVLHEFYSSLHREQIQHLEQEMRTRRNIFPLACEADFCNS